MRIRTISSHAKRQTPNAKRQTPNAKLSTIFILKIEKIKFLKSTNPKNKQQIQTITTKTPDI